MGVEREGDRGRLHVPAARDAPELGREARAALGVDVLDHRVRVREVEGAVLERQLLRRVGLDERTRVVGPVREVDAGDVQVGLERAQTQAAAADVEHAEAAVTPVSGRRPRGGARARRRRGARASARRRCACWRWRRRPRCEDMRVRAAVVEAPGGPEALVVRDLPRPEVRPGGRWCRSAPFGLNRAELMTRRGESRRRRALPARARDRVRGDGGGERRRRGTAAGQHRRRGHGRDGARPSTAGTPRTRCCPPRA